jgi:hypothetical protein
MNVELQIADQVVVPSPKDVYELVVDYMHGDANGFSTDTYEFDPAFPVEIDELKFTLKGLNFMQHAMTKHQEASCNKMEIRDFFETLGFKSPEVDEDDEDEDDYDPYGEDPMHPDVEEFIECFSIVDTTDESYSYQAQIHKVTVFYYDEDGKKFNVDVTFN